MYVVLVVPGSGKERTVVFGPFDTEDEAHAFAGKVTRLGDRAEGVKLSPPEDLARLAQL